MTFRCKSVRTLPLAMASRCHHRGQMMVSHASAIHVRWKAIYW